MKRKIFRLTLCSFCSLCLLCASSVAYSKTGVKVKAGADIVSSYIWRGSYNAGASFQPALSASIAGVTVGAWGSMDFTGQQRKEVDLSLNYSIKGFTVGITDYWWEGEGKFNYFHYDKSSTAHKWEANFAYQLPIDKFPLIISWNTMFAGADYDDSQNRCYSSYVEILYPFKATPNIEMTAFVGATPWYSPSILSSQNRGFSVCNVGLSAQYAIKCSDNFQIPIFSKLMFNPAMEDIHLVFGVSLFFGN